MPAPSRPQFSKAMTQQNAAQAIGAFRPVGIRAVAATLVSRPRASKTVAPKDIPAILRAEAFID